jgi:hypothetical protein
MLSIIKLYNLGAGYGAQEAAKRYWKSYHQLQS